MNVEDIARRLGVDSAATVGKAKELCRIASLKLPAGSLGQGEVAKTAVCLELACAMSLSGKRPLRDEFVRYSCTTSKVYIVAFNTLQKMLDVRPSVTLREAVSSFGCLSLEAPVASLMAEHRRRFLASLDPSMRARADFGRPAFLAAALHLVARRNRVKVEKPDLLRKLCVTSTDFNSTVTSMTDICADLLGLDKAKEAAAAGGKEGDGGAAGAQGRKRARGGDEEEADRDEEEEACGSGRGGAGGAAGGSRKRTRAATRSRRADADEDYDDDEEGGEPGPGPRGRPPKAPGAQRRGGAAIAAAAGVRRSGRRAGGDAHVDVDDGLGAELEGDECGGDIWAASDPWDQWGAAGRPSRVPSRQLSGSSSQLSSDEFVRL